MPEITSASVIVGDLPVSSCLLPLQFLSQHFSDVIRRFFFMFLLVDMNCLIKNTIIEKSECHPKNVECSIAW